ncbi:MAG TPA: xanthine dehydrogenase family protein molybdopterin-binding subunit [Solirubrobacteraceae bacterium]|nr:xanthine dehydrogenase family protein molybdopterin-binding subunit [Solirubrobacteraceae bacterium]
MRSHGQAVGRSVRRVEDARLLRGAGRFVDDVDRPGQLWMRVVRAASAHAEIRAIDRDRALALPGVHAVLTAADLDPVPRIPVRLGPFDRPLDAFLQPVLADGRGRYVGEPVAAVVADDPYLAEDAAELVAAELEPLPVVLDARAAVEPGAPALHQGGNEALALERGYGDVEAAFARAAHVVEVEVDVGRHSGVPLETRGLVADYDDALDRLTIWGATKVPHFNRRVLAGLLGMDERRIALRTTDAGGGFGVRGEFYPEDFLVPFLARALHRPVKWIEDRAEHLVATNHSRQQRRRLAGAFAEDGELLALRDTLWHDNGAYVRTHGVVVPELTLSMLPGPYRVPAYEGRAHVALTNKTPCGTYRGPGRYEATFARERLLDAAADELGVDRVALRRRNLLGPEDLPHHRDLPVLGHPVEIDAGDFAGMLDAAIEHSGYEDWVREAETLRGQGRAVGTGLAYFLEKSGGGGFERARVSVDEHGRVRVAAGGATLGQGIETVLAQVAADELGVEPGEVEVTVGDTDLVSAGGGSWASRSTIFAGGAVRLAAEAAAERARDVAADLLEAAARDILLQAGRAVVAGSEERSVALGEIAAACDAASAGRRGEEPGLTAGRTFVDAPMTYPYGVHLAQVEVDPATGGVRVRRYFIGYEVGRAVNPALVDGQLAGGAAQGLGGALMEAFRYDAEGQPQCTSFMDYLLPSAAEVPRVGTHVREDAPSPGNPLGAKGAGEGGVDGAGAAVAAAVEDALGATRAIVAVPIAPENVRAITADRTVPAGA